MERPDRINIDISGILQGDEDDWKDAAVSMADIYAGAVITVAATWAQNSNYGCFSPPNPDIRDIGLEEDGLFVRLPNTRFPLIPDIDDSWPLLKRAWIYQERKMSPRVAHMGKEQLFWECDSVFLSEDGVMDNQSDRFSLKQPLSDDPFQAWRMAVEHYSHLQLTYEKDRLPAISALVRHMQLLRADDVYIAGMWRNSIVDDLSWFVDDDDKQLPRPYRHDTLAPSWSWISITSGVKWRIFKLLPAVRLVHFTYNIVGPAQFGIISRADLTLEAQFAHVKPTFRQHYPFQIDNLCEHCRESIQWEKNGWDFDFTTAVLPSRAEKTFTLLLLSFWGGGSYAGYSGCVVRKLEHKRYERVGFMIFHDHSRLHVSIENWAGSLPVAQFAIV